MISTASSADMCADERKEISFDVDVLVDDPIRLGYLLAFCESQYCVENVSFIIEVQRFKDIFSVDTAVWGPKTWRQIDSDINLSSLPPCSKVSVDFSSSLRCTDWPSTSVLAEHVEAQMRSMWETFFSETAPSQICVPAKIFDNTVKRLKKISTYGPEVFGEAMIDPLKTLKRDIVPRFLSSDIYRDMCTRLSSLYMLPTATDLRVDPPEGCPVCSGMDENDILGSLESLDLLDMISDKILYEHFLTYLRSIVASENILCARMIDVFKSKTAVGKSVRWPASGGVESDGPTTLPVPPSRKQSIGSDSVDMAWQIYLYFVATGSAFEVGAEDYFSYCYCRFFLLLVFCYSRSLFCFFIHLRREE